MPDIVGYVPYASNDDTRSWVESVGRVDGKIKPQLHLRIATDTNYIFDRPAYLYPGNTSIPYRTKAMMNIGLPGQRIPGITSWNVTESIDTVSQSASFEALNCLPVSEISTTLTTELKGHWHPITIQASYAASGLGVLTKYVGNNPIPNEDWLKYRVFTNMGFTVADGSAFPDTRMPNDDDGQELINDYYFPAPSNTGAGAYYCLINDEVVRVINKSGNNFTIPPGGRSVNGVLQGHPVGSVVKLLGFAPWSGEWTGMGYLNVDDYNPQKALLRPGTCLVSYEGYGNITGALTHSYDRWRKYTFTGYWFVRGVEPSLGEDGVPRIRVDLASAGRMFETQKISRDILRRAKTQFGQWRIGEENETIWSAAGHTRNIPGDWVDYDQWDPSHKNSYPLKILIELAQHKEFYDHMRDSTKGLTCPDCHQERKNWLKTHENPDDLVRTYNNMSAGPEKDKLGNRIADLQLQQARQIGRHVYLSSIRVLKEEAGPIKTYIRLMATLAAAAWDHPAYGNELAQRFTKIPAKLFDNIRNIHTGLVYNGQIDFDLSSRDKEFDWFTPGWDDEKIVAKRKALSCPFSSTYDMAPFSQPMLDLANVNDATFWVNREGYPVFVPRNFPFRPSGRGYKDLSKTQPFVAENSEWFMSYGGSISAYSHSINSDAIMTQCWVTAESAFEGSNITVISAGTGLKADGTRVNYAGLSGNKEGLALTSGVQQPNSASMENQVLGLDWNTNVEAWGIKQEIDGGTVVLNALPALYDGAVTLTQGIRGYSRAITRVQKIVNFFLVRRYLAFVYDGYPYPPKLLAEDGRYGAETKSGVLELQTYLRNVVPEANRPTTLTDFPANGNYTRNTYKWIKTWLGISKHYIKFDIWWYVQNDKTWEEYLAAITGIPVPFKSNKNYQASRQRRPGLNPEDAKWIIDDKGMMEEVEKWIKEFAQAIINYGNKVVDDSLNKATARTIQSNLADPRIQPGDTIWCEIPGFLGSRNEKGDMKPPFTNGIYVQSITRTMTLEGPSPAYTATYSGHRAYGNFGKDELQSLNHGWDFID